MEIREIKNGVNIFPPITFGFECYPVYYKNNPYVVQIKVNLYEIRTIEDSRKIICAIFRKDWWGKGILWYRPLLYGRR